MYESEEMIKLTSRIASECEQDGTRGGIERRGGLHTSSGKGACAKFDANSGLPGWGGSGSCSGSRHASEGDLDSGQRLASMSSRHGVRDGPQANSCRMARTEDDTVSAGDGGGTSVSETLLSGGYAPTIAENGSIDALSSEIMA